MNQAGAGCVLRRLVGTSRSAAAHTSLHLRTGVWTVRIRQVLDGEVVCQKHVLLIRWPRYFAGEYLTEFLKNVSGDMACHSKHSNGVSGHYYFLAFNFFLIGTYLLSI